MQVAVPKAGTVILTNVRIPDIVRNADIHQPVCWCVFWKYKQMKYLWLIKDTQEYDLWELTPNPSLKKRGAFAPSSFGRGLG